MAHEKKRPRRRVAIATPTQTRVVNLYNDYKRGRLFLHPEYQRTDKVWDNARASGYIETLILTWPTTNMIEVERYEGGQRVREIVDGVQRCTRTFAYIQNEFALTPSALTQLTELGGQRFRDLCLEDQDAILEYDMQLQRVTSDAELYGLDIGPELFRRLNSGVPINPSEAVLSQHVGARKYMQSLLPRFERLLGEHAPDRLKGKLRRGIAYSDLAQGLMGLLASRAPCGDLSVGGFRLRKSGNNPGHRQFEVICEHLESTDVDLEQLTLRFNEVTDILLDVWGDRALQRQRDTATRTHRVVIFLQFFGVLYLKQPAEWWICNRTDILAAWDVVAERPLQTSTDLIEAATTHWIQLLEHIVHQSSQTDLSSCAAR